MLKNKKGFTLIELLAVIVILGVLMMTAIPAMSTYIENAKKDVFLDDAKSFINMARYGMLNDGYTCGGLVSSGVSAGTYYIKVDSTMLEKGGTSPWGGTQLAGYVKVDVTANGSYKYSIELNDNGNKHGIGVRGSNVLSGSVSYIAEDSLKRINVLTGANAIATPTTNVCTVNN